MYKIFFLFVALAVFCSCSTQPVSNKVLMYIGTTSNDTLKGIEYCYFDTVTGHITQPELVSKIINPNFLEVDVKNGKLYAVGQANPKKEKRSVVREYSVDKQTGQLLQSAEATVKGRGPCYVALDKNSKELMVAYYGSGEVSAFKVKDQELMHLNKVQHYGDGPFEKRQKGPHAHSIDIDPSSNFIYSADLGTDKLMVYKMTGQGLTTVDSVMCKPGAGPRHFDFSLNGELLAVLNELNCTVSIFSKNERGIYGEELQSVSLLTDTFSGFAKAADIHFSADSKFLYASNRGFDCIAVFKVNEKRLEFVEFVTEGVEWPRNFTLDPSGNYLLVANRNANNISVYKRDIVTGKLSMLSDVANVGAPICIKFFE